MRLAKKILVVDDKYYIRQLVMTALGLKNYTVFAAPDGRDGLEVALRERPDLILLDLLMPGMDGYELTKQLRSRPETASIPIVIMSARSDIEGGSGILSEVNDVLPKPFDLDLLYAVVERYAGAEGDAGACADPADDPAAASSFRARADEVAAGRDAVSPPNGW